VTEEKLPVESLWSRRSGLVSLLVAVIVSLIGIVLDRLLLQEGLPRLDMLIFSNSLTGLFAGGLFWQMAREAKSSRDLVAERMKTIAELNHHIRNALQVIKFLGVQNRSSLDAVQLQLINDSVDRIEWALREVLPRYQIGNTITPLPDEPIDAIRPVS
jgi:two-component sensor histidine kinase